MLQPPSSSSPSLSPSPFMSRSSPFTPLRVGLIIVCCLTLLFLYLNVHDMWNLRINHSWNVPTHGTPVHPDTQCTNNTNYYYNYNNINNNSLTSGYVPDPFTCPCSVLSPSDSRISLENTAGMYVVRSSTMTWAEYDSSPSRATFEQPVSRTSIYRTFAQQRGLSFMTEATRARFESSPPYTCSCYQTGAFVLVSSTSQDEQQPQWQRLFTMIFRLRQVGLRHDIIVILPVKDVSKVARDAPAWTTLIDSVLPPRVTKLLLSRIPGVHLLVVEPLHPPPSVRIIGVPSYIFSWQKLWMWKLTRYTRVVYLDLDVVVLSDPTSLLMTAQHPMEFASVPMACDATEDHANINGGIMVLAPSIRIFDELNELASKESPTGWGYSEQELLLVYYVFLHPHLFTSLSLHWSIPIRGFSPAGLTMGGPHHWYFRDMTTRDIALSQFVTVHFVCGTTKQWDQDEWDEQGGTNLFNVLANIWQQHRKQMKTYLTIDG